MRLNTRRSGSRSADSSPHRRGGAPVRRVVAASCIAVLGTAGLAACGSDAAAADDTISVVASTDVWGSVAQAVAGDRIEVTSLITDPAADPHSYEATPRDAAAVSDADLVVFNGGGYDHFFESIVDARDDRPAEVDAFSLFEQSSPHAAEASARAEAESHADHGAEDHAADQQGTDAHAGHDHSGVNEHVFYDLPTATAVAHGVADALAELDPSGADTYRANADAFGEKIRGVEELTATIARAHPDASVVQTEPLAVYLLAEIGAHDLTPPDFANAVENGTDPSPAVIAETRGLLENRTASALLYNVQTADRISADLRAVAEKAGLPVVEVHESLPEGLDYVEWQTRAAQSLADALSAPRPQ